MRREGAMARRKTRRRICSSRLSSRLRGACVLVAAERSEAALGFGSLVIGIYSCIQREAIGLICPSCLLKHFPHSYTVALPGLPRTPRVCFWPFRWCLHSAAPAFNSRRSNTISQLPKPYGETGDLAGGFARADDTEFFPISRFNGVRYGTDAGRTG